MPRRVIGTWLVWHGRELALVARRGGREVDFRVAPTDPVLTDLVTPWRVALTRAFEPERALDLEIINGEPAATSPFLRAFAAFGRTREAGGAIRLRRSYGD